MPWPDDLSERDLDDLALLATDRLPFDPAPPPPPVITGPLGRVLHTAGRLFTVTGRWITERTAS